MKKNSLKIKRLVGLATLSAIVIVLQVFSNYIQFGPVSITLALIPIVVGAILYGPGVGALLGFVWSGFILVSGQASYYMGMNALGTVITVLGKGT